MSVEDLEIGPEAGSRVAPIMSPKNIKHRRGTHGPPTEHYPWDVPAGPGGDWDRPAAPSDEEDHSNDEKTEEQRIHRMSDE